MSTVPVASTETGALASSAIVGVWLEVTRSGVDA
jgi:hypothetical protein